jgi:chromosome segregation ATPase
MSSDEFEQRFNNSMATIVENQARFDAEMVKMQEAIAGLIQVARIHDEQIGEMRKRIEETSESVKQTTENLNALIRIVDRHVSNHP